MENIDILVKLDQLGEKKKRKKRAMNKYSNYGQRIPLKKLTKNKVVKRLDKETLEQQLFFAMPYLAKDLTFFFKKNESKLFEDREELADFLSIPKVSKAFESMFKDNDHIKGEEMLLFAISEIHLSTEAFKDDEKVLQRYLKIIKYRYRSEIKKTAKLLSIEPIDSLLIVLMSILYKTAPRRIVRERVYQTLKLLYEAMDENDVSKKNVKKVLKMLFKFKKNDFMLYALLEKTNRKDSEGYDMVTTILLEELNRMDRDDCKELLKTYSKCRRNNLNIKRRINFCNLDEDDYRNVTKVVDRLMSNGLDKAYFI